jgi:hypothetical protein
MGISDTVYDLNSVFYHAAQRGRVYAKYKEIGTRKEW